MAARMMPRCDAVLVRSGLRSSRARVLCWLLLAEMTRPSISFAADELQRTSQNGSREKVRILYRAPEGCPDERAFLDGVRGRVGSDWEAAPEELARRIDVQVRPEGERYVASIEFLNAGGERVRRVVSGKFCANVVNGIALVTALAIDSRVEEALEQSEPATAREPADPVKPAPRAALPPRERAAERVPPAAPLVVRAGARAGAVTGVGPTAAFGPGLFAGVEASPLELAVAVDLVRSGRVRRLGVAARYQLISARLEAGPRLAITSWLALSPAGFFEAGALRAEAEAEPPRVERGAPGTALWLAPGVVARAAASWGPLFLGLELMGRFPLVREQFYVETDGQRAPVVHRVPEFSAGTALAAGVRL